MRPDAHNLERLTGVEDLVIHGVPLFICPAGESGLRGPLNRVEGFDLEQGFQVDDALRAVKMEHGMVQPGAL